MMPTLHPTAGIGENSEFSLFNRLTKSIDCIILILKGEIMAKNSESMPRKSKRGDKAIARLLDAGVEAFARYGLEGIATRQLAKAAGVNVAAIAYYFGGKEGYYLAVVRHLVQERAKPVRDLIERVRGELSASRENPETAVRLLLQLLHGLAVTIMLKHDAVAIASIFSREQLRPTDAFEVIYEGVIQPMHQLVSQLVAQATRKPPDTPETIIRAHVLLGQVLFFRIAGTTLCRRLGWNHITEVRAEHIANIMAEMAGRAVGLDLRQIDSGKHKNGVRDET